MRNVHLSPLSDATDTSLFGAKASNLAKAIQLGFIVPSGLAISRLCTESEFAVIVQEIINELSPPIAVRSSAVKEDSEDKAFAGMFKTKLGVRTTANLLNAFTEVKYSGVTDIVRKYHGETIAPQQIGVLVQCMVNATRAGIAFSREPVTGEKKVIIESNYRLGKSVVDGDVTPDSIEYLNDGTYEIFIGRKSIQILLDDVGICEKNTPETDSQHCSLTKEEIHKVASLTRNVEEKLGFPADIEWAIDANNILYLLQARPITTIT